MDRKKDIGLGFGEKERIPRGYLNKEPSKFDEAGTGYGLHVYPKYYGDENLLLHLNIEYAFVAEETYSDNIGFFGICSFSSTVN